MTDLDWEYLGEVGVDAATVALWDRDVLPVTFQIVYGDPIPLPPTAVVSTVGDDIDAGIFVNPGGDVVRLRLVFVDDVDELEQDWRDVGELHLPSGHLVLSDPYCSPNVPYRQQWEVRPGRWRAEELYWGSDLEAVRITWVGPLDPSS